MTPIVDSEPFDPSVALTILDGMVSGDGEAMGSTVVSAWEAAWIACLTNSPAWASVSAAEFAHVVGQLRQAARMSGPRTAGPRRIN